MRKLVLALVALVVLGGLLYPVWTYLNRDRAAPAAAPSPEEDEAPGLDVVEDVNPFDSLRVDPETGTWVLYLLEKKDLEKRVAECQAFVADGRFYRRYPEAKGKPLGLRVELSEPLARSLRNAVEKALSKGPLSWFEPQ